jgi:hypothetical protein
MNRQNPVIISLVALAPASPLADNSTPDLSSRRIVNDEETETLCVKSSSYQDNPQSASSVNRSLERSRSQYHMLEVKLNEPSTAVLTLQVGQMPEKPINSDTNGEAIPT